jgi:hypothetical protein
MFRKLEKTSAKSVRPEAVRAFSCQCKCGEYRQQGEKVMPLEASLENQISAHFVVKG